MIVALASTKGGCGKTTLAINLAIGLSLQGQDVLLADADVQGTACSFTKDRESRYPDKPRYTAAAMQADTIRRLFKDPPGVKPKATRSQAVIDVGGRDSAPMRAALLVADLVIIPTAPRSFDLWGVEDTMKLVREARKIHKVCALAVLNCADWAGNRNQEALELLGGIEGLDVYPDPIGRRAAYPSAADEGLSVLEYMPNNNRPGLLKAREEMTGLLKAVYTSLEWRLTA